MNKAQKLMEKIEHAHNYGVIIDLDEPFSWFEDGILVTKKDWGTLKAAIKKAVVEPDGSTSRPFPAGKVRGENR